MATSTFVRWASGAGARLMPIETYKQQAKTGIVPGIADLEQANRAWLQATAIGAAFAHLVTTSKGLYSAVDFNDSETDQQLAEKIFAVFAKRIAGELPDNSVASSKLAKAQDLGNHELQIRGMPLASLKKITLKDRELAVATDTHRLYVGDGTTAGGIGMATESEVDEIKSTLLPSKVDKDGFSDFFFKNGLPSTAAAHNAIYRGADLTARHKDGSLSAQVKLGNFDDIFIGDFITATTSCMGSTVTTAWRVADIDYYIGTGSNESFDANHHLVLVPDAILCSANMNDTDTTAGGYQGSKMYKTHMPQVVTAIRNAFGADHVLTWNTALSNKMEPSQPSMAGNGWTGSSGISWDTGWVNVSADLMSEPQLYGTTIFSSSFNDVWTKKAQFNLFRLNRQAMNIRANYWLSAIASAPGFAYCNWSGDAGVWGASGVSGVRPHFLYH